VAAEAARLREQLDKLTALLAEGVDVGAARDRM
jgi:hypothetical protein